MSSKQRQEWDRMTDEQKWITFRVVDEENYTLHQRLKYLKKKQDVPEQKPPPKKTDFYVVPDAFPWGEALLCAIFLVTALYALYEGLRR